MIVLWRATECLGNDRYVMWPLLIADPRAVAGHTDATRSSARFWVSVGLGMMLVGTFVVLSNTRACGRLTWDESDRALSVVTFVTCAVAFLWCPRQHWLQKTLTLMCLVPAGFVAVACVGEYVVYSLSDPTASHLLSACRSLDLC